MADIRQQYPQYSDLSDQQLADGLHAKYYSDMPQQQFYNSIGFNPGAQQQPQQPSQSPSILTQGQQMMAPINIGASRFGGNITQDIGAGLDRIGATALGNKLYGWGSQEINNAPSVYGSPSPTALAPNLVENLAQGAPYALLPGGAIKNVLGAALYGATQSQPGQAVQGAGTDAAISAGLSAIPLVGAGLKSIYQAISPETKMNNITQAIGNPNGLEANGISLAADVREAYEKAKNASGEDYQPIMNAVGNNKIYDENTTQSKYLALPKSVNDTFDTDTNDLHENFLNNPTFSNGKELSSQFGANIGSLQKAQQRGMLDQAGSNTLSAQIKAKNALDGDMTSSLNNYDSTNGTNFANQYQTAKANYIQNVVPYRIDPPLNKIATGQIKNPQNVSSYFANPEDSTNKIASDLPQSSWDKIIFDKLGSPAAQKTPEAFNNAINNLDKQGLTSFLTPSTNNMIDSFKNSLAAKDAVSHMAGMAAGAVFGSHLGEGSELLGGLIGQKALPWILKNSGLGAVTSLVGKAAGATGSAASKVYKPSLYGALAARGQQQ